MLVETGDRSLARTFPGKVEASKTVELAFQVPGLLVKLPVKEGQNNSAIDLDEKNKRLFIITRKPFKFVVVNTDDGQSVASFDAPGRTNGLVFDAANRRIYASGDDYIGVFAQEDADHYKEIARVPSEKGAKTSYLVPEVGQLYLAVGGAKDTKAGLLRYAVTPGNAK